MVKAAEPTEQEAQPQATSTTALPSPSPARVLLDEQLIHEADLAQELGRTIRAVSNLAKKHGLRRVKILRKVYYRKDALRSFIARIGQKPARRRRGVRA